MMLVGRIEKAAGPWWYAECDIVGAYTQGRSRKDARAMLADCIATMLDHAGVRVTATEIGEANGGYNVRVDTNEPGRLATLVLTVQRERNKLSLADVAKKLGATSRKAYARYEQGAEVPSLAQFIELLAAVAPGLALTITPRAARTKRKAKAG